MSINLLIADDHALFADGLSSMFTQTPDFLVNGIASDGEELLKLLAQKPCDLVLLDVSMPGMGGLSASEKIVKLYPAIKILVITMNEDVDTIRSLMKAGVHGIILKNTGKSEMLLAIEEVMKGESYYSQKITKQLANNYYSSHKEEWQLTRREKEVLQLIYEGLSTAEMAEKLFVSAYTIETHRKNLFIKSGLNKSALLVKKALELGYLKKQ